MSKSYPPKLKEAVSPPESSRYRAQLYLSYDTIVAIASGLGGAIAILRLSGPDAFRWLSEISPTAANCENRKITRAHLRDPKTGEILDDATFAKFENPHSFTGEDVVEFYVHGGEFVAQKMIATLISLGARQALPGEFSFRAIRNGKTSLSQAQAVTDLIRATNEGAVKLALEKMSGAQNKLIGELANDLRQLSVLGEVGIDFSDQDVEEVGLPALKIRAEKLLRSLQSLSESYARGNRLQNGVGVALVGLPNAGKSSFFNLLLGEDRSIVSEIAGTTRDIVREKITLTGKHSTVTFKFEDTAGLRPTQDFVEQKGIDLTLKAVKNADIVVFLVDPAESSTAIQKQWKEISSVTDALSKKTLGILTKADLFDSEKLGARMNELAVLGVGPWQTTSALNGHGLAEVIAELLRRAESYTARNSGEILLTRLDHLHAVNAAVESLRRAQNTHEIDLFASDVRLALNSLGPLIGDTLADDILGKIFSDFCIGK